MKRTILLIVAGALCAAAIAYGVIEGYEYWQRHDRPCGPGMDMECLPGTLPRPTKTNFGSR